MTPIALLSAACLLLVVFAAAPLSLPVAAESAVQVVLQMSATDLLPGDEFVVEVHLLDCPDLSALGPITVQLDATRFSAVAVERGATVPEWLTAQEKNGRLLITYLDGSPSSNQSIPQGLDVLLCSLRFMTLADAPLGTSPFKLVGTGGFVDSFDAPVSSYATDSPPITIRSSATPTSEPTETPTPEPVATSTPSTTTPEVTSTPTADESPSPTPGTGNATAPSWLWTAWLITLGVALLEFLLLIGLSGRRSRPVRRR
jgi:cell division septation protein DedD